MKAAYYSREMFRVRQVKITMANCWVVGCPPRTQTKRGRNKQGGFSK